ncbi:MAG TPA: GntR family transcriptional regulator [Chloroflexota bacterium]|nr:GntR family transcriptional regulator [Chloroflexota bacterium]
MRSCIYFTDERMVELSTATRGSGVDVEGGSLSERVYRRLAADIAEGRLAPGRLLLETALAKELGVSRTPVRDALRLLANEGLVEDKPEGLVVAQLTVKEVQDLLQTEAALDSLACRLAAQRGTAEQMVGLEEIMARMELAAARCDPAGWMEADRQLHQQIAEMADNNSLARFISQVNSLLARTRHLSVRQPGRLGQANQENRRVVEAIKTRDCEAAVQAMEAHVRNVEQTVLGILENFVVPFAGERF